MKQCCVSGKLHYVQPLARQRHVNCNNTPYPAAGFIVADAFAHAAVKQLVQDDTTAHNVLVMILQGQTPKLQSSSSTV